MTEDRIASRLRILSWLALVGATVICAITIIAVVVMTTYSIRVNEAVTQVKQLASDQLNVLCGTRDAIQKTQDQAIQFLRDNPQGVRIGGTSFTPIQMARDIADRQNTLDAMGELDCD
jgi:predicted negative regulator of RcsB-dependent stress response